MVPRDDRSNLLAYESPISPSNRKGDGRGAVVLAWALPNIAVISYVVNINLFQETLRWTAPWMRYALGAFSILLIVVGIVLSVWVLLKHSRLASGAILGIVVNSIALGFLLLAVV